MKKNLRYLVLCACIVGELLILYILCVILDLTIFTLFYDLSFYLLLPFIVLSLEEVYVWAKQGKRSEFSDLVFIFFFLFLIYFLTKDFLTSIMGAFSIYLWVGVWELKDYPVINKILLISLITYTVIFIAGLISFYIQDPIVLNTSFSFSFWIILILGFILFGRKYIVVWRFMSPQYLTLFLYIIGWLVVVFIDRYTIINFIGSIYLVLILVNILTYFASGFFIDKLLGIKKVENDKLNAIISEIKADIGIKGKVKRGFGEYPILNAMAYGPFFDRRIAIIAEDISDIPEDELRGIIAHELAHTKGNHTLLLALLTIGDLIFRMFVGIPATMYDYTFGNPQIPFIWFIVINIAIYIVLYFFVRVLEGQADLNAKNAGYKNELAKALYNLESFYATGREFGLNTMLLCEEKITENNQILDYIKTSEYIDKSLVKPSRPSLLSNFLDSHPPTYYRLIAILGDDLSPLKEAFLPIICLSKSKQKKYAALFKEERRKIKIIANDKIKNKFGIGDVPAFFESIGIKDNYKIELNKSFVFKNTITGTMKFGQIKGLNFIDDFSQKFTYQILNLKTNTIEFLNPIIYEKKKASIGNIYQLDNGDPFVLQEIHFNENKVGGHYVFTSQKGKIEKKEINKTKLPISLNFIQSLENKTIFFKSKGQLKILECVDVKNNSSKGEYSLSLEENIRDLNSDTFSLNLKDIIVHPYHISYEIGKSDVLKEDLLPLLSWLKANKIKTRFYLKKPVNNIEIGKIIQINTQNRGSPELEPLKEPKMEIGGSGPHKKDCSLEIKNIFNETKILELSRLDFLNFEYKTGLIRKKDESSFISKLFYRTYQYLKPEKIKYN